MKNEDSVFQQTVIGNLDQVKYEPSKTRHYVDFRRQADFGAGW